MYLCLIFVADTSNLWVIISRNHITTTNMKKRAIIRIGAAGIDIFAFVVIYLLIQIAVSFIFVNYVDWAYGNDGRLTDYGFFAIYLCSMVPILIFTTRYESMRHKYSTPVMSSWRGFDPTAILWGFILLACASIALSPIKAMLPDTERTLPTGGWTLVTVCVLAPIFEEIIFRGRVFSMLHRSVGALSSALITALLFGLVHGDPRVMIDGFVAGMIFSFLYIRKGSIIAPILVHMCNNAIAYALMILSYQDKSAAQILGESVDMTIVYIVSVVVMLVGFAVVIRTLRRYGRGVTEPSAMP